MFVRKKDLTTRKLEMFIRKKDLMTMLSVKYEDMDELTSSDGFPKPIYVLEKYRKLTDMEMYEVKDINNWLSTRKKAVEQKVVVANIPIDELGFSVRARRVFKRAGVKTVGEINEKTEEDFEGIRNCGLTTINEIKEILLDLGISDCFRKPSKVEF
ncbi:MAG: DNA-directed RNA polymerase subunit alpha C-terminal domain-containing protein [Chryseobacterium sp.]|jgi:DNA-directed RNA polymerase subunit alpha